MRLPIALILMAACGTNTEQATESKYEQPVTNAVDRSAVVNDASLAPSMHVESVTGSVKMTSHDKTVELRPGTVVPVQASIRTENQQEAVLTIDNVTITVEPQSEITTIADSEGFAELQLEHGRIRAKASSGGRGLRVRNTGSSATAETHSGDFAVFNDGRGMVAIAAATGQVRLTSSGGDAILAGGERAVYQGDTMQSKSEISREVLLKVVWPTSGKRKATLRGSAEPGSRISINGNSIPVQSDGGFAMKLVLDRDKNLVRVEASDLLGRTRAEKRIVRVRDDRPKVETDTRKLWK